MPGYLSNRYITFNPVQEVQELDSRISEAEENIEDLQLNIGV